MQHTKKGTRVPLNKRTNGGGTRACRLRCIGRPTHPRPWSYALVLSDVDRDWTSSDGHWSDASPWLAAPSLASDYFAITTLDASVARVPWFFSLALRPRSAKAIALPTPLLSLSMVGRTVIAFGLFCHLHACCLGSTCAMVLRFGLAASLTQLRQSRCSACL